MEILSSLFTFAGGIGMFLFGMNRMADGMQKTAGGKMKSLLGYLTRNRFLAICVGALITAVIQSSGATTVMVVGFVNAGIMDLVQAVGVIMGANIGTTITAWIVSLGQIGEAAAAFKPAFYAPLLIGVGAFVGLFSKKDKFKIVGELVLGIGLLFEGLEFMSGAIAPYTDAPIFSKAFEIVGNNPLLGIIIGIIVTAILQSSSASVGILQTLAMNGVVTTNAAVFITLGQNIGSCVTALISCVGTTRTAKRAACMHLLFNIAGALLFGVIAFVVFCIYPSLAVHNISAVEISMFHTLFNITCTLVMCPFAELLVKLSGIIIPEKHTEGVQISDSMSEAEIEVSRHFDTRVMGQPAVALERAKNEVVSMAKLAYDNIEYASRAVVLNDHDLVEKIYGTEEKVDYYAKYLTDFLVKVNNLSLTDKQHFVVNNLFHAVIDLERISDRAENLAELAQYKIENEIIFSDKGNDELKELFSRVLLCLSRCITAREKLDRNAIKDVYRIEDQVDDLEDNLRNTHIQRLSDGLCEPAASVVFLDVLTNLERVSDHCKNIAEGVHDEISSN
jgi:phosphate:Na+ symporter